jgi:hypothetical protein
MRIDGFEYLGKSYPAVKAKLKFNSKSKIGVNYMGA